MLSAVNSNTKIVFVANPNNPTGSYISRHELTRLHAGLPQEVLLVIDDAYAEYVEQDDYSDGRELVSAHENVVMLRTFSKIYGLSSLRLGWAYAPPHVCDVLHRIRGPFNVSTPAQLAGAAAVRDISFTAAACEFNRHWLAWLSREIQSLGFQVHPSVGNFILVEFPGAAAHASKFLMERGLIVREVSAYGLQDCLRITIGLEADNRAVVAALSELRKLK
jgi:histidinol-phosphate aminotransferase